MKAWNRAKKAYEQTKVMHDFSKQVFSDMDRICEDGQADRAVGREMLSITDFMKKYDAGYDANVPDDSMDFDAYMMLVRMLYHAYEIGYNGTRRQ